MGETKEQLMSEIEQARTALDRDLDALEQRVAEDTDWRLQIQRHPLLLAGAAIGCGLILGLFLASLNRA